jgi:2-polyprenyl-3-methyl-5-hydroxy-6-metoxy-1,4-benzoquinol methylase/gluconate kinase
MIFMDKVKSGVIWISGYSGSGKSTVAREVVRQIKYRGGSAILLDGDNLRSILQSKWGYSREERIELARTYFQLSSYRASQDTTVIIAAVALYDEVRSWLRVNIPNCLEVFLNVTDVERRRRDAGTKGIYRRINAQDPGYQLPRAEDGVLILDNSADVRPSVVAETIIRNFVVRQLHGESFGKSAYWNRYYAGVGHEQGPTPFAEHVVRSVTGKPIRLLEVGCGSGRDAVYFASVGHSVVGLDSSHAAIERCRAINGAGDVRFVQGTISNCEILDGEVFDVIYGRFVLHAMTKEEEKSFLRRSYDLLATGGRLMIAGLCNANANVMKVVAATSSRTIPAARFV